jgi:hypothetical protein
MIVTETFVYVCIRANFVNELDKFSKQFEYLISLILTACSCQTTVLYVDYWLYSMYWCEPTTA